jgi:hypothetical protein
MSLKSRRELSQWKSIDELGIHKIKYSIINYRIF